MPLSHSSQVKPSSANESAYAWAENLASTPIILGQDHAGRQMATAAAWKDLLPKLVYPYMEWQEGKAWSELPNRECMGSKCCDCIHGLLQAEVKVISFLSMFQLHYYYY